MWVRNCRPRKTAPPEDDPIPWPTIQRVQADLDFLLQQDGVSIARLGEAMGDHGSRGTISAFRNLSSRADYRGNFDNVTRNINQFIEDLARRSEQRPERKTDAPMPDGFVQTDVAKRILVVVEKCIALGCLGLITGDAGRGKTLALRAAQQIYLGAVLIRVRRTTRAPGALLRHIAQGCGVTVAPKGNAQALETRLIEKLKGTGRCLLIDESHQLKPDALEILRDLHDEAGVPIVLSGTHRVQSMVDDEPTFYGQLSSRIGIRYAICEPLPPEVPPAIPTEVHAPSGGRLPGASPAQHR